MTLRSTVATPRREGLAPGVSRILIVHSPDQRRIGDAVILGSEPVLIGRGPEGRSTLLLDDDQVSRTHTSVEPAQELAKYSVRDHGSRNGTFVNGAPCESRALEDGDVVRVVAHLLLFQSFTMEECRSLLAPNAVKSAIMGPGVRTQIVRQRIAEVGPRDVPVLIFGETGVGKELVARELHAASSRRGEFVAVNCAALPEHLVESELFGHMPGAFTGATDKRPGLFVEAEGGTLFLDEIGEMPLPIQAKLLRALATGEIRPVGATKTHIVDTRVVAATNVDLERAVDEGTFRADLHARLLGATVAVPPLRERREDVLPLLEHFLSRDGPAVPPTADAAEALLVSRWRYNVRELEQTARALAPAARRDGRVDLEHLPDHLRAPVATRSTASQPVAPEVPLALRIRRDVAPSAAELEAVLVHFEGNIAQVGEFFGKDRRQIYRWAERLGLDLSRFRDDTK